MTDTSAMRQLITDMQACPQTENQSVYEHGLSVWHHIKELVEYLKTGDISSTWVLPSWLIEYRQPILNSLAPVDIIEEYAIFHDCGKPYCQFDGTRRFPNHAEISYLTWLSIGGRAEAARLMRYDMLIHTMKSDQLEDFIALPEATTLILSGLAEVHANAKLFGGFESTSFKIKWGQIDRRGRAICKRLFAEKTHASP